jgi:hypothetical protein
MMDYIFSILAAIVSTFSGILMFSILIRDRVKRKTGKDKLFKLLTNNFEQSNIGEKEDILFLINSVNREFDTNYSLISILEDYIVYLSKDEINEKNNNEKKYGIIKNIIKIEIQEKPFNNVPDEEKRILRNVNENIKNNQIELIKYNLQELSSVITTRNKIYEKANKINRWSLPIAVISIIVAVIFGLIGLWK